MAVGAVHGDQTCLSKHITCEVAPPESDVFVCAAESPWFFLLYEMLKWHTIV